MQAELYYLDRPIASAEPLEYLSNEFFSSRPLVQVRVDFPELPVPSRASDEEVIDRYVNEFAECFACAGLAVTAGRTMVLVERAWGDFLEMCVVCAIELVTGVMPWIVIVDLYPDGSYRETLVLDTSIYDRLGRGDAGLQ